MAQFGTCAPIAPVVGVGGSHDALPMAILIGVYVVCALAVNVGLGPAVVAGSVEGEAA